jgi:hypothetical protein
MWKQPPNCGSAAAPWLICIPVARLSRLDLVGLL